MNRLGFEYHSAQAGSQINEKLTDSPADQRAIKSGFFHQVTAQKETYFDL